MHDREPRERLPVLIYNRGGNRTFGAISRKHLNFLAQFARRGYLVLASQYRGGVDSQGADGFGGDDVNDVLALIELAGTLPFADANNLFMYGHSRGGMMTYLALARTDKVRAAVVAAGVSDLDLIASNRADMGRLIRNLVGPKGPAWEARSAVQWPERLSAPILLFHARDDELVSIKHATKMETALKKLGREHKLVSFRSGGHSLAGHGNEVRDQTIQWFEKFAVASDRTPGKISSKSDPTICDQFGNMAPPPTTSLAQAMSLGDMAAFKAITGSDFDANAPVSFSHRRFAGGREIHRPPILAAALFGRTDMVELLLGAGASIAGSSASAICAAVVMDQVRIVKALLDAGLDAANYRRCGRSGSMAPLQLAQRLGKSEIANLIRQSGGGRQLVRQQRERGENYG